MTTKGARFKDFASLMAKIALKNVGLGKTENPVSIKLSFYFKTRAGDVDNCTKAILDSFKGIIYFDDKQVADNTDTKFKDKDFELCLKKYKDKDNPRTEVEAKIIEA